MKSLCSISRAPPIRSSPFLSLSRASLNRFTLKIPPSLYLSPPKRCSFSKPSSSQDLLDSHGGIMSNASISVLEDESIENFKVQVGNPSSPLSILRLPKLSLSDQAFLLLAFIACTVKKKMTDSVFNSCNSECV